MATNYIIDSTDGSLTFQVTPYTTNGPQSPNSSTLDDKAVSAATSLLFYGKGSEDYGERTAENFVHLLENFASDEEPVYPIAGQFWFKKSSNEVYVCNETKHEIVATLPPYNSESSRVTILGDHRSRIGGLEKVRIYDDKSTTKKYSDYTPSDVRLDANNNTFFRITPSPTTGAFLSGYVTGWDKFVTGEPTIEGDIDLKNTYYIYNLSLPSDPNKISDTQAINKKFVNDSISSIAGQFGVEDLNDVTLSSPTDEQVLVYRADAGGGNPGWVNSDIGANLFLPITGGIMQGNIFLGTTDGTDGYYITKSRSTTIYDDDSTLTTKDYVDSRSGGGSGGASYLDDLLDVNASLSTNLFEYDFLLFQGKDTPNMWENISGHTIPTLIGNRVSDGKAGVVPIDGIHYDPGVVGGIWSGEDINYAPGRMTGPLLLSNEHNNTNATVYNNENLAVSVLRLNEALVEAADGRVSEGVYDYGISSVNLIFHSPDVNNPIPVEQFVVDVSKMRHYVKAPSTSESRAYLSDKEEISYPYGETLTSMYPGVSIGTMMDELDKKVGNLSRRQDRWVYEPTANIKDKDILLLPFRYPVGHNVLSVYQDGIKLVSSTFASVDLKVDNSSDIKSEKIGIAGVQQNVQSRFDDQDYDAFILTGSQLGLFDNLTALEVFESCGNDGTIQDCSITYNGTYTVVSAHEDTIDTTVMDNVVGEEGDIITLVLVTPTPIPNNDIGTNELDDRGRMEVDIPTSKLTNELWSGYKLWKDDSDFANIKMSFSVNMNSYLGSPPVLANHTQEVFIDPLSVDSIASLITFVNGQQDSFIMDTDSGKLSIFAAMVGEKILGIQDEEFTGINAKQRTIVSYQSSGGVNNADNFITLSDDLTTIFTSNFEFKTDAAYTTLDPMIVGSSIYDSGTNITTVYITEPINATQDLTPVTDGVSTVSVDLYPFFSNVTGGRIQALAVPELNTEERVNYYTFDSSDLIAESNESKTYSGFDEVGIFGQTSFGIMFRKNINTGVVIEIIAENSGI